jgi:hypothetical protein
MIGVNEMHETFMYLWCLVIVDGIRKLGSLLKSKRFVAQNGK